MASFLDISIQESKNKVTTQKAMAEIMMFRLSLYLVGVEIGFKKTYELEKAGYISNETRRHAGFSLKGNGNNTFLDLELEEDVNKKNQYEDRLAYVKEQMSKSTPNNSFALDFDAIAFSDAMYEKTFELNGKSIKKYDKRYADQILKSDWNLSDQMFNYSPSFYNWIQSINSGWGNIVFYNRFHLYKKQAQNWIANPVINLKTIQSEQELFDAVKIERARCLDNSLYALNTYLKLGENNEQGYIRYKAWEAQAAVLYMFDCYLSAILGKLRQIGFTSTIAAAGIMRTMLSSSYNTKLIAQKGEKSESIYEQKVKFPIEKMDWWMKPEISSYTGDRVLFGKSNNQSEKGSDKGSYSSFSVESPTADAINSGTPSLVLLDEIGLMGIVGEIISQGRPTMFRSNPLTGKMEMVRQLFAWGTGGNMKDGASGMKGEWKAAKEAWADKDFRHGLIPVFINAEAKPGFTKEFYESEMAYYYRKKKGPQEKEDPKVIFHYTYPMTEDDMFLESSKTIIPIDEINKHLEDSNKVFRKEGKRGMFQPIYDINEKADKYSDVPFKIIGAEFIPAANEDIDNDSPTACVHMLKDYSDEYTNVHYKGTDPVNAQYGVSKFSTAIWHAYLQAPICVLSWREPDTKFMYLQSLLMNLYYGGGEEIWELLEINIGQDYLAYCKAKGFGKKFVRNHQLPEQLQLNSSDDGISKKPSNAKYILYFLEEIVFTFRTHIKFPIFWNQLKTFVEKQTPTGASKHAPANKNFDNDDVLDAVTYARICALVNARKPIQKKEEAIDNKKTKVFFTRDADFNLIKSNSVRKWRTRQRT